MYRKSSILLMKINKSFNYPAELKFAIQQQQQKENKSPYLFNLLLIHINNIKFC